MKKSPSSVNLSTKSEVSQNQSNRIEIRERVRYSETDRMGIAHNKNYFEWFEIGRTEFCRKNNIPYKDIEEQGYYLVVAEAYCRYKKPLRYDETFIIRIFLKEATEKKIVFNYELLSSDKKQVIAYGHTVHISTNIKGEVTPLPEAILEKLTGNSS